MMLENSVCAEVKGCNGGCGESSVSLYVESLLWTVLQAK